MGQIAWKSTSGSHTFNEEFNLEDHEIEHRSGPRLTFDPGGRFVNGTLNMTTNSVITGMDEAGYVAANLRLVGNPFLEGTVRLAGGVVFAGRVSNRGNIENANYWYTTTVRGDLVNDGLIRNSPRGYAFNVDAEESVSGNGTWAHSQLNLTGIGRDPSGLSFGGWRADVETDLIQRQS